MGEPHAPEPVMLVCGVLAGTEPWLDSAVLHLRDRLGPLDLVSETFPFTYTDYYTPEMGPHLLRRFVSFERLIDPGDLPRIKRLTNALEGEATGDVARPINLDPGTVNGSQLVLASTKPHAHRIYLADGIYAEVTLLYREGQWTPLPWTYPDYAAPAYHGYLCAVRQRYLAQRRASRPEE